MDETLFVQGHIWIKRREHVWSEGVHNDCWVLMEQCNQWSIVRWGRNNIDKNPIEFQSVHRQETVNVRSICSVWIGVLVRVSLIRTMNMYISLDIAKVIDDLAYQIPTDKESQFVAFGVLSRIFSVGKHKMISSGTSYKQASITKHGSKCSTLGYVGLHKTKIPIAVFFSQVQSSSMARMWQVQ